MKLSSKVIITAIAAVLVYKVILPGFFAANSLGVMGAVVGAILILWGNYYLWSLPNSIDEVDPKDPTPQVNSVEK